MIDSLGDTPERLPTVREFETAIESLKMAIDDLPTSAPSFQDQALDLTQLRGGTGGSANSWQEIETVVRSQFTHHQSYSLDRNDGSVKVARAIGCTPEIKRPIVTLEVELRENGRVSIVSSYRLDDEEYPFFLGDSSANHTALVVAELTACLTYITAVEKGKEGHSSPAFPRSISKANRQVQKDLNAVCEELGPADEMTARLRHRLEWECLDAPAAQCSPMKSPRTPCISDGGESVQCILCGDVPVQGPTLEYKNWRGKLMFCEPCLRMVKKSIEEEQTVLETIADELG